MLNAGTPSALPAIPDWISLESTPLISASSVKVDNFRRHYDDPPSIDADDEAQKGYSPERSLLFAIIEQAGRDAFGIRKRTTAETLRADNAHYWLYAKNTINIPFSYQWMCDQLDLCPLKTIDKMKEVFSTRQSRDIRKRFQP